MDAIINSKLFIPIIILLVAAIISIIMLSYKKKRKKVKQEVVVVEKVELNQILPDVPKEEIVVEKEEVVYNTPLPTIDVKIPDTTDSEAEVSISKPIENEVKDEVIVEKTTASEEVLSNDEIISITKSQPIANEADDSVTVEKTKPNPNDVGENIIIKEAFEAFPDNNRNINEDIKVEEVNNNLNQTEIFNLEEIQEALKNKE